MIWLAVEKDGSEMLFNDEPERYQDLDEEWWTSWGAIRLELPRGSIERLIKRKLTWKDEPVILEYEL